MHAITIDQPGGPEALVWTEVPDPVPINYPTVAREQISRFVVLVEPAPAAPYIPDVIGFISV